MITESDIAEAIRQRQAAGKPIGRNDLFWAPQRPYPERRPGKTVTTYSYSIKLRALGRATERRTGFADSRSCASAMEKRVDVLYKTAQRLLRYGLSPTETLWDYCERILATAAAARLTPQTLADYRADLTKRVLPYLGHVPVTDLTPVMLRRHWDTLSLSGDHSRCRRQCDRRTCTYGRPLAAASVQRTKGALGKIIRLDEETFPVSVVLGSGGPKVPRPTLTTWTHAETIRFFEIAPIVQEARRQRVGRGTDLIAAYGLGGNGLRAGEAAAVAGRKVDLTNGLLTVDTKLSRSGTYGLPKGEVSRNVIIVPFVSRLLARHIAAMPVQQQSGLLFQHADGQPLRRPDQLSGTFSRTLGDVNVYLKQQGEAPLPVLRFHDLRHTFATLMHLSGADMKSLSAQMGHADVAFTLRVYVNSSEQAARDNAQRAALLPGSAFA